jgi:DNA (cytosine-5)-methyltransferase 1
LIAYAPEIARCVATREGSSQDYESTTMVAIDVTGQTSHALTAEGADASEDGTGRGTPVVCVHADAVGRTGDALTPSIDAAGVPRIRPPGIGVIADGTSYNLMDSGQPHAVAFVQNSRDEVRLMGGDGSIVGALAAEPGAKQQCYLAAPAVAFQSSQSGVRVGDVHATLDSNNGSRRHNGTIQGSAVRRLTPMECERLQGFPDGYTAIPWRGKPAEECPDGPRYKALGNSWAVPKFVWLGKRIAQFMPKQKPAAANNNDGVRDEKAA